MVGVLIRYLGNELEWLLFGWLVGLVVVGLVGWLVCWVTG